MELLSQTNTSRGMKHGQISSKKVSGLLLMDKIWCFKNFCVMCVYVSVRVGARLDTCVCLVAFVCSVVWVAFGVCAKAHLWAPSP